MVHQVCYKEVIDGQHFRQVYFPITYSSICNCYNVTILFFKQLRRNKVTFLNS